jgi:hydroxymethylglutaryl-CoA lyase
MARALELSLPPAVTVYEVGPRDGLQNESTPIPSDVKVELIDRLGAAGVQAIETTSFVRPEWVPQLADAREVEPAVRRRPGVRYAALVPNQAGLARAIEAGVSEIAVFGSVTESFSRRNLNRTVAEALTMFAPVVEQAHRSGVRVRGYLSMVFGDPWEGEVSTSQSADVARRMWALGVDELSLGDTIGVGTPLQVQRLITALASDVPVEALAVHLHDTYGQALADSSVGGLGGCPYAHSATGNVATEDLVYMLNGLGVHTGIDLGALVETAWWIGGHLGREPESRVSRALRGARAEPAA